MVSLPFETVLGKIATRFESLRLVNSQSSKDAKVRF